MHAFLSFLKTWPASGQGRPALPTLAPQACCPADGLPVAPAHAAAARWAATRRPRAAPAPTVRTPAAPQAAAHATGPSPAQVPAHAAESLRRAGLGHHLLRDIGLHDRLPAPRPDPWLDRGVGWP
jgi:hypothetical protein